MIVSYTIAFIISLAYKMTRLLFYKKYLYESNDEAENNYIAIDCNIIAMAISPIKPNIDL